MLASLTACATNKADINDTATGPRKVSTGDLRPMNNRGVTTESLDDVNYNRANDLDRRDNNNLLYNVPTGDLNQYSQYMPNSTTEIQPMNNGFITIAHNSYSTDTPSHRFPHTQRVNQGNYWYYTFQPAKPNADAQPKYGMVTPQRRAQTGQQAAPTTPPAQQQPTTQAPVGISQMAQQVINLTNVERKKAGLPALTADPSLSRVAQTKTNDMEAKHYFSHTSPTYGSPFDMMRDFGVSYKSAGENIAMGQTTAQQVVTAWMNSEGHRKNILSASYTNIGVGFTSKGNYWSQMFIGK